jgi:hypothetical protein
LAAAVASCASKPIGAGFELAPAAWRWRALTGSDETVFLDREVGLKQSRHISMPPDNGVHHADIHPQRDLPRISQERIAGYEPPEGNTMTEIATFAIVFLGIGIFLAHAIDALRTP